ncbi:hypothetical protein [Aquirhabdus parva]|uniref:ATP-binding protein n=1 Tax=Aquirhabdus parva TaxID=2283318 RepID=A0A345P5P5_9GAMM|nr:hypothetical protein [Aquirhabdus parva]AXI02604.1 hypothetical protein HYN46_07045 [Aquirhabdus parva]
MKPPEQSTPETLLATFPRADAQHDVYGQYGLTATPFYTSHADGDIGGKSVGGWLALPMYDSKRAIVGIAFLSPFRADKPVYYPEPYPVGATVLGTPAKDKPLFVVSSPEAAFAISRTGLPCLLTFTPRDYGGKHDPVPKDGGNMTHVIKSWSMAGYAQLYAPVGCDIATTYQAWFKDLPIQVLGLTAPINQYQPTSELTAELTALTDAADHTQTTDALATIEYAFLQANDRDNPNVGALWEAQTLAAFQHIYMTSKPEWARLRVRLKQCKAVKLADIEREIIGQSDESGYNDTCSMLIDVASSACTFVHDPDSEPYAILTVGNVRQCWHLNSKSFQEWLSYAYYKSEGTAPSDLSLKAAISSLSGRAKFDGDQVSVNCRTAKHDGAYWLDLCNDTWQAVKISAQGWQVIDQPSVLFTRSSSMRQLPMPTAGAGNLNALWAVANIPESERLLIVAWLLECLRPETPYVVLELSGEQGSAKSSTQDALRNLIDPNRSNLRTAPKNKDDVFINARNSHLVSYENLSHLSADYQDALCTLATGGGFASRTLYTNTDETVIDLKKPIILNGISVIVTAQDLLDRAIHIDLPVLSNTVTESELDDYWQIHHSGIFSSLLDVFVSALAQLPHVDLSDERLPRMADFTLLGEAVYQAHGQPAKTFLHDYRERRKDGIYRTLEASPVAMAMQELLRKRPSGFVGTVQQLLNELEHYREDNDTWVKSAKGLADLIQRLKPAMRQIGIYLSKDTKRSRNGFGCTLRYETPTYKTEPKSTEPSASSTPHTPDSLKQPRFTEKSALGVHDAHRKPDLNREIHNA